MTTTLIPLLCLSLLLLATACGGNEDNGGKSDTGSFQAELIFPEDMPRRESAADDIDCQKAEIASFAFTLSDNGSALSS